MPDNSPKDTPRKRRRPEDVRSIMLQIRITPKEKDRLFSLANEAEAEVSDYVRGKIFNQSVRRSPRAKGDRAELIKILGELGKVGSNVNQIARAINRRENPQGLAFDLALQDIASLGDQIRKALLAYGD